MILAILCVPDFSQVEVDATQIAADERFALFYPERRPFFVEGVDQFNVPNTLVYTRAIVQLEAAVKLTGKVGRTDPTNSAPTGSSPSARRPGRCSSWDTATPSGSWTLRPWTVCDVPTAPFS